MKEKYDIVVFTDGSSRGNPGPGGWGAIIAGQTKVHEHGGREKNTTNNRMELAAVIESLKFLQKEKQAAKNIIIATDSVYVKQGATSWIYGWQKNNWINSQKKPVLNKDLWEELAALLPLFSNLHWVHVRGHVGTPANERADEIATSFADQKSLPLFRGPRSRYSISLSLPATSGSSSNKGRAYCYLSLVDGRIERHENWSACQKRVNKQPQAKYRRANSEEEAKQIINLWREEM